MRFARRALLAGALLLLLAGAGGRKTLVEQPGMFGEIIVE
jgi:hypothetical protein